jgi:hypothetical protein
LFERSGRESRSDPDGERAGLRPTDGSRLGRQAPEKLPSLRVERASGDIIRSPWEKVLAEAFLIRILDPVAMAGAQGVALYRDEFGEAI